MAGPLTPVLAAAGGLIDLGRVLAERLPPPHPEERRRWKGGREIGELAGLVAFLDVRIPDLEARRKRFHAVRLRAIRARSAARLAELRRVVGSLSTWDVVATAYRDTIDRLHLDGAVVRWPDGREATLIAAFRFALSDHELLLRDQRDDDKAAATDLGGDDGKA